MSSNSNALHIPSTAPDLPGGWRWERLDVVCGGIFDCPHSTPILTDKGPLIVRSQDMRSGVFRIEEAAHVSEETYRERIARAEPVYGDLLYSREGTYFGIAAEAPPATRFCLGQRMVLLRPDAAKVNFRFLRYWLNSPIMARHIHGQRDGSVAERLNLPTIRGLPVAVPPLDEQRAIAHILGTLEDKIELNRRMNETLETMVRTLFKSWFVDFTPVRAKAEGRDTGLPMPLADLFPNSFMDSDLGEIPKGWEVCQLQNAFEIVDGKTLPATTRNEHGQYCAYGANGIVSHVNDVWVNSPCIILGKIGTCGALHRTESPCWVTNNAFAVRPGRARSLEFAWHTLRSIDFSQFIGGSANPYMPLKNFGHYQIILGAESVLDEFEMATGKFRRRQVAANSETLTLAALRDTLVTKLVIGNIRVKDAERIIGGQV